MTSRTKPETPTPPPSATDIYISGLEAARRQLEIVNATLRAKVGELEARVKELEAHSAKE